MKPTIRKDITGMKFGKLFVQSLSTVRAPTGAILWNCICECGKKTRVRSASLKNGNTKSCGCLKINNLCGDQNYQARRLARELGEWSAETRDWYGRAGKIIQRARDLNLPCDFKTPAELSLYLKEISPKKCPVFNVPLSTSAGAARAFSPSTDRIIPEKGYTRGNIQVISMLANKMKQNATPKQLKQFARWVLETTR